MVLLLLFNCQYGFFHHPYGAGGTMFRTDAAPLAVDVIDDRRYGSGYDAIRAIEPA